MQNKQIVKYYEYQLTKSCLDGKLEGFKVSSWFLKVMKVVEYGIAKTDTLTSYFTSIGTVILPKY